MIYVDLDHFIRIRDRVRVRARARIRISYERSMDNI